MNGDTTDPTCGRRHQVIEPSHITLNRTSYWSSYFVAVVVAVPVPVAGILEFSFCYCHGNENC